ncbi:MAG TPA: L,D-transpeptidase [Flavobacterium sp.]|uniref:L,D-transpeptidase n=1 Tax=unclassified Flavobacterium TaxID=196869 RepID=UPI0025C5188A|nr:MULTISPECIES: L,D-transpeptidase [unclassified Flavobacterium]HRE78706.1 L,D-transpeptidase [Flavobacterium sp.]
MMTHFKQLIFLFIFAVAISCQESKEKATTERPKPTRKYDKPQDFTYTIWSLKNDSVRKVFKSKFSSSEITTIVSLNRIDKNTLQKADTLIIPNKFDDDFLAYSAFPYTIKKLNDVPKIAIFSYPIQAYGLYEYGELVKWGPTSLGSKAHKTPTGLFFTNWKGEEVQSTVDDEWILRWNFNIENTEGVGWHQYELPGYPASHSCLRLLENDAKWMYDWADEWILKDANTVEAKGIPVLVFGEYDFDGKSPWLKLVDEPKANDISEKELENLVSNHLSEIMKEQENREKVLSEKQVK